MLRILTFCAAALLATGGYFLLSLVVADRQGEFFVGSDSFSMIARRFLETGQFISAYRPPLYPLFLAGLMTNIPEHWQEAAIVIQGLGSVLCCAILYQILRQLNGSNRT
ncbi:MAG TPA: hypothetical protein PLP17_08245, partial [Oligoflexia bacterium]|nr:hypothetical protein [Oligoflexia bacterium]